MKGRGYALFVLLLFYAPYCTAQLPPCSERTEESNAVKLICDQVLPMKGRVLALEENGEYCSCACRSILQLPLKELLALLAERDSTLAAGLRNYHRTLSNTDPTGNDNSMRALIVRGNGELFSDDRTKEDCSSVEELIEVFHEVRRFTFLDPTFEFVAELVDRDMAYPLINGHRDPAHDPLDDEGRVGGYLIFPARAWRDSATGKAFYVFMALHELAHAHPDVHTEYDADMYAANALLMVYHDEDLGAVLQTRELAAAQFENYTRSQYPTLEGYASDDQCSEEVNKYPKLSCRAAGIRRGMPAPAFVENVCGYPRDCCRPSLNGDGSKIATLYEMKRCSNDCSRWPALCELAEKSAQVSALLMLDRCDLYPDLCKLGAGEFLVTLDKRVPARLRLERRVDVRLDRALRAAKALNMPLVKTKR